MHSYKLWHKKLAPYEHIVEPERRCQDLAVLFRLGAFSAAVYDRQEVSAVARVNEVDSSATFTKIYTEEVSTSRNRSLHTSARTCRMCSWLGAHSQQDRGINREPHVKYEGQRSKSKNNQPPNIKKWSQAMQCFKTAHGIVRKQRTFHYSFGPHLRQIAILKRFGGLADVEDQPSHQTLRTWPLCPNRRVRIAACGRRRWQQPDLCRGSSARRCCRGCCCWRCIVWR